MKVLVVAGARPNFMKVAPILNALERASHQRIFVHTGQHYDASMSDAFFRDLGLPIPDRHLGVGSGSHARQTARVMEAFEPVLEETRPDWIVVVGDVNSTLACALVASKLRGSLGCRIAHVEAGLRSNDWARWRPLSDLVGTVISIESVTISNEVPGTVTAVEFQSGAIVEKGQVILTLDASTEEAELRAAEASIRVSEAAYQSMLASERLARANYERVKQAAEAKAAAAMDVDERRSAADTAKADSDRMAAQIEQAKALADRVRTVISKKTIHAPFRARAGLRNIHPGQYLKEGTEIVSLQSITDDIYLDFALPQEQAWRAKPGMVVVASSNVLGDKPVEVKVVALDSAANPDTRNVRVRTIVSNKDGVLRPGMFVQVSVPTGEETEQVVVPVTAVRRATFGDHVFVVAMEKPAPPPGMPAPQGAAETPPGEGAAPPAGGGAASPSPGQELVPVARQRMVTVGPRIGENVIILSGLKPGERVAADGSFKLRDGAQITEAPPAGQPDKTVATH